MRILFLALDLRPEQDQAECIHVREIVSEMVGLGHVVLLLASKTSSWRGDDNPRRLIRAVGGGRTLFELFRVLKEAKRFGPEVVYERRFLPKIAAAVSAIHGIPAIVEINGLVDEEMAMQGHSRISLFPPGIKQLLHRFVFHRMAKIVAVTNRLALAMSSRYRVADDRLAVVENAANTRLFRPLDKEECRRRVGVSGDRSWICFEGGLYPWHDVPTALRAVRALKQRGMRVGLLVVGDGPCRAEIEALSKSLELDDTAYFVGKVPYAQVPEFIGASDVGIGPFAPASIAEVGASPMKIYEYVACGRPVVSSRLHGIGEWIEAEQVGRLAEPGDPTDFAVQLADVLQDHALQRDLVLRGPQAVARGHSWEAVAGRLLDICRDVAAN